MVWLRVLLLVAAAQAATAAKILSMVPMPAKSHAILFDRLMVELANRGHQVTHVSIFPKKNTVPNLRNVVFTNPQEKMSQGGGPQNLFEMRHMGPLANLLFLPLMGHPLCEHFLEEPNVKALLNEKFDLVISEAFLTDGCVAAVAYKTGAKIVSFATFMPNIWATYLVGNPAPSSYIPDPLLGYQTNMNFKERLLNFLYGVANEMYHTLIFLPTQEAIMKKHIGEDSPSLFDIIKNTSLLLVNHHYSLGFPRPTLPNMIEVGGIHVEDAKPLPKDLQDYMDQSKQGVILFSFGSALKSVDLRPEMLTTLFEAFSRLKQNVLWKFENDELPNKPKNVKISKWLPQSDILAHPNLKLFITHGGLLSTTEAVVRKVPVVGIPVFGDQPLNMRLIEKAGFGKGLDFDGLTPDLLVEAVDEVLNNPKYRQSVEARSRILLDTPMKPLDTAIYWIEYVLRHKGAPHLRSAAQDLAWYQLYLLDVYALLAVISLLAVTVQYYIVKFLIQKLCGSKSKAVRSKKKKN